MNLRKSLGLGVGLVAAALVVSARVAPADTLILNDGTRYVGTVTFDGNTYTVVNKIGTFNIEGGEVATWDKTTNISPEVTNPPDANGGATPAAPADSVSAVPDPALTGSALQLIQTGSAALEGKDYNKARDAFRAAIHADAKSSEVREGLAVALMKLDTKDEAWISMETAVKQAKPVNRALALNDAALALEVQEPLPGAQTIQQYLTNQKSKLDVPAADALATLLKAVPTAQRNSGLFGTLVTFYETYDHKLEAARPGQMRWGTQWLPAATVKGYLAQEQKADKQIADAQAAITRANAAMHSQKKQSGATLQNEVSAAQQKLKEAKADEPPAPTVPTTLATVALNDNTPPDVKGDVADAAPVNDPGAGAAPAAAIPAEPAPHHDSGNTQPPSDGGNHFGGTTLQPGVGVAPANVPPANPAPSAPPAPAAAPDAPAPTPDAPAPTPDAPAPTPDAPASSGSPSNNSNVTQYASAVAISPTMLVTASAPLENCKAIFVHFRDGKTIKATLVRSGGGLALVQIDSASVSPLPVAAAFSGGAIQCDAIVGADLFTPSAQSCDGSAAPDANGTWTAKLSMHPQLPGAPLVADGKIVGVEICTGDEAASRIPVASVQSIRALLGADLPDTASYASDPRDAVVQLDVSH